MTAAGDGSDPIKELRERIRPDTLDAGLSEIRDRLMLYHLTPEQYTTLADAALEVCREWGNPERTTPDISRLVVKLWEHLQEVGIADPANKAYIVPAVEPAGEIPACDCDWLTRTHSTVCARHKWQQAHEQGFRDGWAAATAEPAGKARTNDDEGTDTPTGGGQRGREGIRQVPTDQQRATLGSTGGADDSATVRSAGSRRTPADPRAVTAAAEPAWPAYGARRCRVCGCTQDNCGGCIDRTGEACHWIEADLCSACAEPAPNCPRCLCRPCHDCGRCGCDRSDKGHGCKSGGCPCFGPFGGFSSPRKSAGVGSDSTVEPRPQDDGPQPPAASFPPACPHCDAFHEPNARCPHLSQGPFMIRAEWHLPGDPYVRLELYATGDVISPKDRAREVLDLADNSADPVRPPHLHPAAGPALGPKSWQCACGCHNDVRSDHCVDCKQTKPVPAAEPTGDDDPNAVHRRDPIAASGKADRDRAAAESEHRKQPTQIEADLPSRPPPGTWLCPCGCENERFAPQCSSCNGHRGNRVLKFRDDEPPDNSAGVGSDSCEAGKTQVKRPLITDIDTTIGGIINPPDVLELLKRARNIMQFHAARCPLRPFDNFSGSEEHLAEFRCVIKELNAAADPSAVASAKAEPAEPCACSMRHSWRKRGPWHASACPMYWTPAAEPAGDPRGPKIVYEQGFKDGRAAAALDWCKAKHAAAEPAGRENPPDVYPLLEYGQHKASCCCHGFSVTNCDCGFLEALAAADPSAVASAKAEPAGVPPDVVSVPGKTIDALANDLIDAQAALIQVGKAGETGAHADMVRLSNTVHKILTLRRNQAAEPAGADNPPDAVGDEHCEAIEKMIPEAGSRKPEAPSAAEPAGALSNAQLDALHPGGHWRCKCGAYNSADLERCGGCRSPKPEASSAAEPAAPLTRPPGHMYPRPCADPQFTDAEARSPKPEAPSAAEPAGEQ